MQVTSAHNIICPIDGSPLIPKNQILKDQIPKDQSLICSQGHNFDIARQGYFNLLVVQHKASRDPGDTKEMVAARRRFLEIGCYEAIANSITNLTEKHLIKLGIKLGSNPANPITILDAGCGEGYYLSWLRTRAENWQHLSGAMIGMDISKWAIQSAAKRDRQITWIVGSNARPPFLPNSIDLIICAFGFPSFDVFHRILKPSGKIIMVDPAFNHLVELRQLIYPELKAAAALPEQIQTPGFNLIDSYNLTFNSKIETSQAVQDLFLMTPHYFRSSPAAKIAIAALQRLEFTVDVSFQVLTKN